VPGLQVRHEPVVVRRLPSSRGVATGVNGAVRPCDPDAAGL